MGWDVGYMGDCPDCGEHVHNFHEDQPGRSAMWLRCPKCLRADVELVANDEKAGFWSETHPCSVCATERENWEDSRCPRCGGRGVGEFIYMPD